MSGLRRSGGLTNLVADTLRFRDLSGGLLTLSDRGVMRNDASPALRNLTVSGQTQLQNTTVFGTLTANSVNALATVRSPYAAIGTLDVSSAAIDSIQITNADISSATIDLLNVSNATIQHADISSAVIDYLPQFDLSGNLYSIVPSYATLPQLIASYNQLITLFANRAIFLSLSTIPVLLFQTHCEIHIAEFPVLSPNTRVDFIYSQPIHLGVAAGSIVATLNQSAINAGAKLRFSFNPVTSKVSYNEAPGYSWIFTDPEHYGSANRFLNHLGITGLIPSENGAFDEYDSGIGGVIANPTGGSPVTPDAPDAPTLSSSPMAYKFTINIPVPAVPTDVKKIGIFLDHGTDSIHSWDIISYPATIYTFHNLVPETDYDVHLTFLSDYDESPLSPALSVTTSAPVDTSFNVLANAATTVPPVLPLPPPTFLNAYNNKVVIVAQTTPTVWLQVPDLESVSQISSIELQYYSGFNEAPRNYNGSYNIQDARFMFYPYPSSPQPPVSDGVFLYYSAGSRMAVTGSGSEAYAIGSSNPPNTSTTPPAPAASVFISEQNTLKAMFGNGTDTIDRTKGFQFAWFCGYGGSLIQNMNISKFIINYET
jgi:hypothetical protein